MHFSKIVVAFIIFLVILSSLSAAAANDKQNVLAANQLNIEAYQMLKQGNYVAAYGISKKAALISKQENNLPEIARAYSNLAASNSYLGENEKALLLYDKSLKISQSSNDLLGIGRALNNVADIYSQLNQPQEELKYRILRLENSLLTRNRKDQLIAYIGLTNVYTALGHTEKANTYYVLADSIQKKELDPFLEIYVLFSKSKLHEKAKDYSSAIKLINRALNIAKSNHFSGLVVSSYTNLAESYFYAKNYRAASKQALQSLSEAKLLGMKQRQSQIHQLLSKIYVEKGNFEKALVHNQKASLLNESLSGEKVRQLGEITRIDRQTKETEDKLIQAQKDQEILSLQLEWHRQNQLFWLSLLVVFSLSIFFIYYRISSNKEIVRQKKLNKQLEELDIVKDRVLTNTSHELRTPLNGIIGLSDIILQDDDNRIPDSVVNSIKLIKSSGEQLSLVVNDILEMSKLKSNKITVVHSPFDLAKLLRDVISICEPSAIKKQVNLEFQESGKEIMVRQDRGRIQQIMLNLVGNAIKFTDSGSVSTQIELLADEVSIFISDSGIGIPSEKIERIFEGFEQVDSSDSRAQSGSGLGLAISRGLAEALGGSLTLHSTLGQGTQVIVTLPIGVIDG